jgi:hypothetical protein
MKKIQSSLVFVVVIFLAINSLFFISDVWAVNISTITSIDKYYTVFVNHVEKKTGNIWIERIKVKIEDRLWSTLLSWIERKMKTLDWEQKILFQTLWSKILQRKDSVQFSTNDLVIQRELIGVINSFREEKWLSQLSYNTLLAKAAYNHANDMYLNFPYDTDGNGIKENISHVGTNGWRVTSRVESLWYNYSLVAENIWYNQQTPAEILLDRENSPTHYENLITKKATQIGVAKVWSYWVMVIGTERKNN